MKEPKTIKAKLTPETLKAYTDLHNELSIPYQLTITNYTAKIESDIYKIYFVHDFRNPAIFGINKIISKEVQAKPLPDVDISKLQYFDTGLKKSFYADKVFNIDIKQAYPSILLNEGYISKQTFERLQRLDKKDRLAAVGMLASHKEIFTMQSGKAVNYSEVINPLANYFFHCVKRTYEIMSELKTGLGEYFLFSWVDSVYFSTEPGADEKKVFKSLSDYLKEEHGLNSSQSVLYNFECAEKKTHFRLSYEKDEKRTYMNIPKPVSAARRLLIEYLKGKK